MANNINNMLHSIIKFTIAMSCVASVDAAACNVWSTEYCDSSDTNMIPGYCQMYPYDIGCLSGPSNPGNSSPPEEIPVYNVGAVTTYPAGCSSPLSARRATAALGISQWWQYSAPSILAPAFGTSYFATVLVTYSNGQSEVWTAQNYPVPASVVNSDTVSYEGSFGALGDLYLGLAYPNFCE